MDQYFIINSIEDSQTKFFIASSQLPDTDTTGKAVLSGSAEDKYQELKEQVIKNNTPNLQQRFNELTRSQNIRDQKPTDFLRCLRELQGDPSADEQLTRTLFLGNMDPTVRQILASLADDVDLDRYAESADRILEARSSQSNLSVNVIKPDANMQPLMQPLMQQASSDQQILDTSRTIANIKSELITQNSKMDTNLKTQQIEIENLKKQLGMIREQLETISSTLNTIQKRQFSAGNNNYNRGRSQSRQRNSNQNGNNQQQPYNASYCYYHNKWGAQAYGCKGQPCTYLQEHSGNA
jgi:hypothetical protein